MKRKKKKIKIKHRDYSLYNRKKSKGRQVLTVILTVVIVAALVVVGYGLGKPIVEYFQNKQDGPADNSSAWTPPTYETSTGDESAETQTADSVDSSAESEDAGKVFVISENAVLNMSSLSGAVAAAKNQGYMSVAVTMKDDTGAFLYKSDIAGIKDSDAVKGSLTAKQIYDVITGAGLEPVARINTLKDHTSPSYIDDIKFIAVEGWGWLDNYAEQGGKPWVSAFESRTATFISDIVKELSGAGFRQIVLADTIFPAFRTADYSYLADIGDADKRLAALWNVVSAGERASGEAKVVIEMNAEDLFASDRLSTTAELANDTEKLKEAELLLGYSGLSGTSGNSYAQAKSLIGRMQAQYSGLKYSVIIDASAMQQADIESAVKAFSESDINIFMNYR